MNTLDGVQDWPPHHHEVREWRASGRGPRADRMFTRVEVSLPPLIATLSPVVPTDVLARVERATVDIAVLDARHGRQLTTFGSSLIRSEAVSSSRIERHHATMDDLAKASIGLRASTEARATVAAALAVQHLVERTAVLGRVDLDVLLAAHHRLLEDDPHDGPHAGRIRDVQNWIGGSDHSPRGAVHVPPPPELVPDLLEDLVRFSNRDDLPALVQAAVAHAQFESIHPFTDGNGRIGRALINAVLRRRGVTQQLVVPVASALVADVETYFRRVNAYRDGCAGQFIEHLAVSAGRAARAAEGPATTLAGLPAAWQERVHPRAGSAAAGILAVLLEHPALDVESAVRSTGASSSAVLRALERLVQAGVLHELTGRAENRAWAATEVLAEIEELDERLRGTSV